MNGLLLNLSAINTLQSDSESDSYEAHQQPTSTLILHN